MKKFEVLISGVVDVTETYYIDAETAEDAVEEAKDLFCEDHYGAYDLDEVGVTEIEEDA